MDLGERRELYNGFGNTLSRAIELAGTPTLLGWLGWHLDGRLGTRPLFTVAIATLAVSAMLLRTWFGYVEAMKAEEAKAPWRKR